jgi:phthiodiolone/phenolphthiodiolone dimycocerosates ketoreductase
VRENNEPYGVEWTRPVAQFEEAVAVIRALWESEGAPVSRDGTWWPLRNALFDVPTYKGTRPPIWIAAQGPRMLDIAGRYGDGWLPMLSFSAPSDGWAPLETPKGYGERLHAVRSAAADAGRDPAAITASGWFFVITGPTAGVVDDLLATPVARLLALGLPADAWAKFGAAHPLGPGFTGGQDLLPHLIDEETALAYAERVPDGLLAAALFAGTPKELAERFAEYTDQGLQHPVLLNGSLLCSLKKGAPSFLSMVSLLRRLRRIKAA